MNDHNELCIATYIINLKERTDRRSHIASEFSDKEEFDVKILQACTHDSGNIGLWKSFRKVIETADKEDEDVILFVEDDHYFTEYYDKDSFFQNIVEAYQQGADILSGGIGGGFKYIVPITENRFWVNHFWCTQFMVIYKKFFSVVLTADFGSDDTLDNFLSTLTTNKMVLFPFFSRQKDFGYSDVTAENNIQGSITNYFDSAEAVLLTYQKQFKKFT
ncbi:glycosyl transferase [Chryseobacterium hagamense]|uniref:Glycosyl transferase n=1 Tax=Chryseobacterium hagamense TaxID=395935 RepID=A0A511YS47_9FLAO|nr:glycosyl transferase [Chryseobacterium hagamense]GEN78027.1 glycosyl transferase [Chryseobacterium hagamense]